MSQKAQILDALKRGEGITAVDALKRYGCFRLAARMHDLKMDGWPIVTHNVEVSSGKIVAKYWLGEKQMRLGV